MTLLLFAITTLLFTSLVVEKKSPSSSSTTKVSVALCIALGLLGASIEPKEIYHLARHYTYIDNIRTYGFTLTEYLRYGFLYNDMNFKYAYVYNIILYVIAKLLPNESLPFMAISLCYASFFYVYIHSNMRERSSFARLTSIALFSVLLPYLFIYSGIRNALASCMVALGVYQYVMKGSIVGPAALSACAIMIHPAACALIPFVLLAKVRPRVWSCAAIAVFPSLLFKLTEFFRLRLGNEFLFRLSSKYYNYLLIRNDSQGKVFLYSCIISVVLIVVMSLLYIYSSKNSASGICYLITLYALFCLGYTSSYELAVRLPYNIAIFSPVMIVYFFDSDYHNRNMRTLQLFSSLILISLSILVLYENAMWLL